MMLTIFSCEYLWSMYLLWWNVCLNLCLLFLLDCLFFVKLWIFIIYPEYKPFMKDIFANILSQFVAFQSPNIIFWRAKIIFHEVFDHFLMSWAYDVASKRLFSNQRSQWFSPMFSSKSFVVLGLIFRSMVHFELNFCIVSGLDWRVFFAYV